MADRPLRRPGHVGHLQLLDVDDRVVLADLGRAFMRMVATAVGGLGMDLSDPQFLPRPVVAEFHFSTQGLLGLTEALLLPAKTVDRFVDGTVRQGGEPHDSCIQSHSFAFRRDRFALGFHLDRHVPPPALPAHREVSQRPVHDPAVAVAHPSEFRQENAAVRLIQFELVGTRDAERLPATFALESRRFRSAGEKVGVRPTQILDGLLRRMARRIPKPCSFRIRSPRGDLAAQGGIPVHPLALSAFQLLPRQSPVVDESARPRIRQHASCLPPIQAQLEAVSLVDCHQRILSFIYTNYHKKRHGRHRVIHWPIRLVWVTPYRRAGFDFRALDALRAICEHGGADFESTLWAMDGATDHVSRVRVAVRH